MSGNTKHGGAVRGKELPEYRVWLTMRSRCGKPAATGYAYYGGRGIRVCSKWEKDFGAFLTDVGRRPSDLHTLDRIDNNGGYEPGNVRWATRKEQSRNARMNRVLEFAGKRMPVVAWAEYVGLTEDCLRGRLKMGWSIRKALTLPKIPRNEKWNYSEHVYRWKGLSIREWAEKLHITSHALYRRLNRSRWKPELVFSRPKRSGRKYQAWGSCLTVAEWSKRLGISSHIIDGRLRRGWSVERALSRVIIRVVRDGEEKAA